MSLSQTWRAIASATLAAAGIAAVWAVGYGWAGSVVNSFFTPQQRYESVSVTRDGAVVIAQRAWSSYQDVSYRTLAGKSVVVTDDDAMPMARLGGPYRAPGLVESPIPWDQRLASTGNWSRPMQAWYLVRDGERPGRACFEAFMQGSKQRAGYYGRKGWRQSEPPRDEWFDIGQHTMSWYAMPIVGRGSPSSGSYVWNNGVATDDGPMPRWKTYVIDGDEVIEVDMRNRLHRTLPGAAGLVDIGTVSVPVAPIGFEQAQAADAALSLQSSPPPVSEGGGSPPSVDVFAPVTGNLFNATGATVTAVFTAAEPSERPRWAQRLAVRGADLLRVLNATDGTSWDFRLPEAIGGSALEAYVFGDDFAILNVDRGAWGGGPLREVLWIDSAGETLRSERLELAGYQSPSMQQQAWLAAPAAPVPALAAVLTLLAPLAAIQEHRATSYAEGLREVLAVATPPLVAVVLLGVLLGAYAAWRHREHRRAHAALWSVFVGLLGPAGLIAYFAYWRRQPVGACSLCGETSPRDRDTCAACGAEWPAPAPLGTEVFDPSGRLEVA